MARTTIEVEIIAILKEAKKSVESFAKTTQKELDSLNFKASISAIEDGFRLLERTAGQAFGAAKQVLGEAIQEAVQGEEAMTRLANSMRLVGDYSVESAADMKAFADDMQRATVFSDDMVLSSLALAKNFSLTNKEAKAVTSAAADFAAATGKDLDSAVQSLSRSLNGVVDKDLARYLPALKAITKEKLVLGEGLRLVADRFRGFAAAMGDTFNGALTKTRNALADLLESIGELIIQNPVVIRSVQIIGETFGALKNEVEGNRGALTAFIADVVKGIAGLVSPVLQVIKYIDYTVSAIVNLFKTVGTIYGGLAAAIAAAAQRNFSGARDIISSVFTDVLQNYEDTRKRINGFYDPLIKSAQEASAKIQALGLQPNKKGKLEITVNKTDAQILADRMRGALSEGADELKKKMQEAFDKQKGIVGEIAGNPFKAFLPSAKPGDSQILPEKTQNLVAAGAGFVTAALSGVEGARKVIGAFAGAVADYFIPGLGPVVNQFVQELSKGPEYIRKMVTEFEMAVPDLVENIFTALPELVDTVIDNAPKVVTKIVEGIPRVIQAFVRGIPEIITSLIRSIPEVIAALIKAAPQIMVEFFKGFLDFWIKGAPEIIKGFINSFIKGIPQIIEGFYKGIVGAAEGFVQALFDAISSVGGLFGGGGGGGGIGGFFEDVGSGIGDFFGSVGDIFGLAHGGSVPNVPRYAGDGFGPVMLNGGEEVLDQSTANKLRAALDDGGLGGGQMLTVNLVMEDKVLASQILRLSRGGFRLA